MTKLTARHWGVGVATIEDGMASDVRGRANDPAPSGINANIAGSLHGAARVLRPAIRKIWLEGCPKNQLRGRDSFVEVSWDRALDLIATDLTRVKETHGNQVIFGGSYGWSSAGRFHHAQSQLKRFLNSQGGCVRSEGNYSYNAALGLMPYIVGPFRTQVAQVTRWSVIAQHADLVVMFGGGAERNTQVRDYLTGAEDGQAKDANWAATICGVDAERIRSLARRMAAGRTMITVAVGVQRTDYGEQPLWMAVTLAAMLGQIGLPGGGYVIGYGVNANIGNIERPFRWGTMSQGVNPVADFIPVAMITEMLMNPGGTYEYQGQSRTFPDARMVWWAGGNPFHHHQDLNTLHDAFQRPETVIVNEVNWTATARHADIVLPVAIAQERTDFGAGKSDNALVPMPQLVEPAGEARIEYEIYADLAARLGGAEVFTDGKSADDWLEEIWNVTRERGAEYDVHLPDWETSIAGDVIDVPDPSPDQVFLAEFRADPQAHPLPTPSGKIQLFSDVIAGFARADCKGHRAWFPPRDVAAGKGVDYPLALLSGQPKTRLHSQLDNGAFSRSHKIKGREPVLINQIDAADRSIRDGDIVELFNDRGRCLAGAKLSEDVNKGCLFLWTGAWYDPDYDADHARDRHGNPNVLAHDMRTSSLTQSPASHSALVDIRRFDGLVPDITVHQQPYFHSRGDIGNMP